ncbi:MAG: hypothetical protein K5694_00100 [Bacilli bacterium]|nr:hypothetical protein [Bacilli bacterium]
MKPILKVSLVCRADSEAPLLALINWISSLGVMGKIMTARHDFYCEIGEKDVPYQPYLSKIWKPTFGELLNHPEELKERIEFFGIKNPYISVVAELYTYSINPSLSLTKEMIDFLHKADLEIDFDTYVYDE